MKMGTSKVTGLFNIEKPIIQAGMIWVRVAAGKRRK